jgi:hypothetical protein
VTIFRDSMTAALLLAFSLSNHHPIGGKKRQLQG